MPKLVIMCGIPGSGKSTKANQIAAEAALAGKKSIILSTDDRISGRNGEYLWSPRYQDKSHELNQFLCDEAMERGYDLIIIDNTNLDGKSRKPYVYLARHHKYEVELVEPDTDWKYNIEECHRRNTHSVPLETITKMMEKLHRDKELRAEGNIV